MSFVDKNFLFERTGGDIISILLIKSFIWFIQQIGKFSFQFKWWGKGINWLLSFDSDWAAVFLFIFDIS